MTATVAPTPTHDQLRALAVMLEPAAFAGHPECQCCKERQQAALGRAPALFAALFWLDKGLAHTTPEVRNRVPLRDVEEAEALGLVSLQWSKPSPRMVTQVYSATITPAGRSLLGRRAAA